MSQFKVLKDVTKMEFHVKKSRFSVKSQFKESKCADRGHSLNRDFTVSIVSISTSWVNLRPDGARLSFQDIFWYSQGCVQGLAGLSLSIVAIQQVFLEL